MQKHARTPNGIDCFNKPKGLKKDGLIPCIWTLGCTSCWNIIVFFLEWIAVGNRLPMAFHQSHPVETKPNTFYWKKHDFVDLQFCGCTREWSIHSVTWSYLLEYFSPTWRDEVHFQKTWPHPLGNVIEDHILRPVFFSESMWIPNPAKQTNLPNFEGCLRFKV